MINQSETILHLNKVSTGYNGNLILNEFSLEVHRSEILLITGTNGSGKSTFFKLIMGFLPVKSGNIYYNNRIINSLTPDKRVKLGISYLFQDKRIFSNMTVEDNLRVAIINNGNLVKNKFENIYNLFPVLFNKRNIIAGQLSGGEQQQLALARVFIQEPRLILLDEPSAGLTIGRLINTFNEINNFSTGGITCILVEHRINEAINIANRILNLNDGKVGYIKEMTANLGMN